MLYVGVQMLQNHWLHRGSQRYPADIAEVHVQVCMTGVGEGEGVCGIGQFSILSPVMFADTVKVARVMAVGGACLGMV